MASKTLWRRKRDEKLATRTNAEMVKDMAIFANPVNNQTADQLERIKTENPNRRIESNLSNLPFQYRDEKQKTIWYFSTQEKMDKFLSHLSDLEHIDKIQRRGGRKTAVREILPDLN